MTTCNHYLSMYGVHFASKHLCGVRAAVSQDKCSPHCTFYAVHCTLNGFINGCYICHHVPWQSNAITLLLPQSCTHLQHYLTEGVEPSMLIFLPIILFCTSCQCSLLFLPLIPIIPFIISKICLKNTYISINQCHTQCLLN